MVTRFSHWLSLEEHGLTGGLGSALLEWLADRKGTSVRLMRIGVVDEFIHQLGNQDYVRSQLGLDAEGISKGIRLALEREQK